ncbi:VOC family protein [Paenibacillus sp. J5C2022]|uniref:VOC family protein n=1 Tax=Paenibacillus sp. J5C2022 TaxID=2977129 RepID=UPI0021D1C03D|nr:VOC family protein [Paenibacillus sp. J5C2022]
MKTLGFYHVGIVVSDLAKSVAFYRDTLGLEVAVDITDTFDGEEISQGLGVPGTKLRVAYLKSADNFIQLMEFEEPKSPIESHLPLHAYTTTHFSFYVEDLEQTMEELGAKGIQFFSPINIVPDSLRNVINARKWVIFRDPDGVLIELVEKV